MIVDYREAYYKIDKDGTFYSRIIEYADGEYVGMKRYNSREEFIAALKDTEWGESEFADEDTIEARLICLDTGQ